MSAVIVNLIDEGKSFEADYYTYNAKTNKTRLYKNSRKRPLKTLKGLQGTGWQYLTHSWHLGVPMEGGWVAYHPVVE